MSFWRIAFLIYGILFACSVVPMTALTVFVLVLVGVFAATEAGPDYARVVENR